MQKISEKHNCQERNQGNTGNSNSGHCTSTSKSTDVKVQQFFVGKYHSNQRIE